MIVLLLWILGLIGGLAAFGSLFWFWSLALRFEMWLIYKFGKIEEL